MPHPNQAVTKQFGIQPRADIPRAAFKMRQQHKTTIGFDNVTPIFCEEALPTDRWHFSATYFGRLLTPIFPIMDNIWLEVFYFFVPARLTWSHWENFISGRNPDPTDSTTYTIPQWIQTEANITCVVGTLWDHFGLPIYNQPGVTAGATNAVISALPARAYVAIWDEWFRDPNWAQPRGSIPGTQGDGPDTDDYFMPLPRYKRKDYFTSSLPWPQAQTTPVSIANTTTPVPVTGVGTSPPTFTQGTNIRSMTMVNGGQINQWDNNATASGNAYWSTPNLEITASAFNTAIGNINQLRTAFQFQKLLERDARSGPRYTEQLYGHFGVLPQDARMQRPEYLGSAKKNLTISQVPQTSATSADGTDTPLGELAAYVTVNMHANITVSIPEHGYIIGVANVTGDVAYQQGIRKFWRRQTRLDFYVPVFAMLGEQPIYRSEIFSPLNVGTTTDNTIFGYQERWAEYRYWPDMITGFMRSGITGTLDVWHLAESFATAPTNGFAFMQQNTPISRVLADQTNYEEGALRLDMLHEGVIARPLPMFSVPGLVDHF